jgi:hypothetical protein
VPAPSADHGRRGTRPAVAVSVMTEVCTNRSQVDSPVPFRPNCAPRVDRSGTRGKHTPTPDDRQILVAPALEAGVAVLGSIVIGVPVGLGLGVLAVRVLGLFFTLPPPLLVVPVEGVVALVVGVVGVVGASVVALSLTLLVVSRGRVAAALRGA